MADQLTFTTLFGEPVTETVTAKPRGKHYVEPRGGADRPGTGPAGETCGSCLHSARVGHGRYPKCELNRASWTHGPKTDIRLRWPACSKWKSNIPDQSDPPFGCPE